LTQVTLVEKQYYLNLVIVDIHKKKKMKNQKIALEQLLNAPISRVWKALTDKNEMKQWYFDLAEFNPEVGFKFHFTGGPSPERQYLHLCEITEVIPNEKLEYSWHYDGYEGNTLLTFILVEQGNKTLLKFSHAGIETFPANNPDLALSNFVTGWNQIIHTSIKEYIDNFNKNI